MPLFGASCLIRSAIDGNSEECIWEEQIFVVEADYDEHALYKAEAVARAAQATYKNIDGKTVSWEFVAVAHCYELFTETLTPGMEVFSRFVSPEIAQLLLKDKDREL